MNSAILLYGLWGKNTQYSKQIRQQNDIFKNYHIRVAELYQDIFAIILP